MNALTLATDTVVSLAARGGVVAVVVLAYLLTRVWVLQAPALL